MNRTIGKIYYNDEDRKSTSDTTTYGREYDESKFGGKPQK